MVFWTECTDHSNQIPFLCPQLMTPSAFNPQLKHYMTLHILPFILPVSPRRIRTEIAPFQRVSILIQGFGKLQFQTFCKILLVLNRFYSESLVNELSVLVFELSCCYIRLFGWCLLYHALEHVFRQIIEPIVICILHILFRLFIFFLFELFQVPYQILQIRQ